VKHWRAPQLGCFKADVFLIHQTAKQWLAKWTNMLVQHGSAGAP